MSLLVKCLELLYQDCKFKVRFQTLDKEKYLRDWESINDSCEYVRVPEFFSKDVDLGEMGENLKSVYAEIFIDNAGYKQPHDLILTSVTKLYNGNVMLSFSSKFSKWAVKRLVIVDSDKNKVIRNDFNDVYELSWKDYREGGYQKKKSTPNIPKLRRPTLTQDNK
jgi:hypothetical protein